MGNGHAATIRTQYREGAEESRGFLWIRLWSKRSGLLRISNELGSSVQYIGSIKPHAYIVINASCMGGTADLAPGARSVGAYITVQSLQ